MSGGISIPTSSAPAIATPPGQLSAIPQGHPAQLTVNPGMPAWRSAAINNAMGGYPMNVWSALTARPMSFNAPTVFGGSNNSLTNIRNQQNAAATLGQTGTNPVPFYGTGNGEQP